MFLKRFITVLLLKTFALVSICAQEVSVSIEPERVQLGGNLQITLSIKNDQIKNYSSFPEINGFIKGGISSSSLSLIHI
mgnify:FL=1